MVRNWIRVISSILLFVGAGVCEIGGGWLVWKFRKEGWHWIFFILGSLTLVLYGVIPTFQSQPFGRTYAAYGGFFIGLSLLWGWVFDSQQPDRWDLICAAIAVAAVIVMVSVPRNPEAGTSSVCNDALEEEKIMVANELMDIEYIHADEKLGGVEHRAFEETTTLKVSALGCSIKVRRFYLGK